MKPPYKLKDGSIVPGVTSICNMLDKPQLLDWTHEIAYKSTVELIKKSYKQYGKLVIPKYQDIQKWQQQRDSAGDIGTLVHKLCIDLLSGKEVVIPNDFIVAKCFKKFLKWWGRETKGCELEVITETPLVSEVYKFGGTPDIFIVNKRKLIDIKTSGGIYESMWIQLAGYDILLREYARIYLGYIKPKEYQIVWIPKDD